MVEFGRVINCGKRKYYSEAAFSLVDETGLKDPIVAIEHLAKELLGDVDVAEPPVLLDMVASFQGVKKVLRIEINESGRLIPLHSNQYRIEVRSTDTIGRQNFSIAHEIGHTLIPSYNSKPTPISDKITGDFRTDKEEELFCDIAASNILLPEVVFKEQCSNIKPSVDGLLELSKVFEASIEAVAFRLDHLSCWNCIPVIWELGLKPTQKKNEGQIALFGLEDLSIPIEEYRVKFHAGSDTTLFFPSAKHIPMDSIMVSTCLSGKQFKGRCIVPTSKSDVECYVEAVVVPYRNERCEMKQRIVSLVFI